MENKSQYVNLSDLFKEIELCDFEDKIGLPLKNNVAYIVLKELFNRQLDIEKMEAVVANIDQESIDNKKTP